jgi:antitoxin component YwqK of YwqJK toxin-antitoxin module
MQNGIKAVERHYYKGKPQGLDVAYNKFGRMVIYEYQDSLIDYPSISFNDNGNFEFVSALTTKSKGKMLRFNSYGDLWQKTESIDSSKRAWLFTEYSNCGDTISQCIIRSGKQPITFYLTSTSEKICEGYINDYERLYVGKWKSLYHNGQLKQEYEFDDKSRTLSTPIGHWLYYNEEGKIIKEEFYDQGELVKTIKH